VALSRFNFAEFSPSSRIQETFSAAVTDAEKWQPLPEWRPSTLTAEYPPQAVPALPKWVCPLLFFG
jgi:hypothetical protein